MYETNLNLQSPNNKTNQKVQNTGSVQSGQLMSNLNLAVDEGDFVLVGANSLTARFPIQKQQPQFDFGKMGKGSATTITTLVKKAEEKKEGVFLESMFSPILGAIFPGVHLLEMLNHGREAFEKINDGVNKNLELKETRNINPIDAMNPSKSFLPVTPFYAPTKPSPLLWDRVRNEKLTKEEENKKKKSKRMGLGAF